MGPSGAGGTLLSLPRPQAWGSRPLEHLPQLVLGMARAFLGFQTHPWSSTKGAEVTLTLCLKRKKSNTKETHP